MESNDLKTKEYSLLEIEFYRMLYTCASVVFSLYLYFFIFIVVLICVALLINTNIFSSIKTQMSLQIRKIFSFMSNMYLYLNSLDTFLTLLFTINMFLVF